MLALCASCGRDILRLVTEGVGGGGSTGQSSLDMVMIQGGTIVCMYVTQ